MDSTVKYHVVGGENGGGGETSDDEVGKERRGLRMVMLLLVFVLLAVAPFLRNERLVNVEEMERVSENLRNSDFVRKQ